MFSVGQKVAAKTNLKDSPFSVQKGSKGVVIAKLHDLMVVSFLCDGSNVLLPVHATDLSLDPPTTNKPTFPAKTENAFGNLQLSYDPEEDHRLAKAKTKSKVRTQRGILQYPVMH